MKVLKPKLVRLIGGSPKYVPGWSKPVLRPFAGMYSYIYRLVYSSIKEEILVRTPMGPLIYVNYSHVVEREIANGRWEKEYIDIFCSSIKKGDVVVDVGANIGIFSLLASKRVGIDGSVYSFEPVPINYERLIRNIKINQAENVRSYNIGLSDKNETLLFNVPKGNPAEATLCQKSWTELSLSQKAEHNKDTVEGKLIPFDLFYKDEGLSRITQVKIDVEGAELKVLKGMRNTLMNNNVELFLEVIPPLIKQLSGSTVELVELLVNCGFKTALSSDLHAEINISKLSDIDIQKYFVPGNYVFKKE